MFRERDLRQAYNAINALPEAEQELVSEFCSKTAKPFAKYDPRLVELALRWMTAMTAQEVARRAADRN